MNIITGTKDRPQDKLPTEILEQILQYLPQGQIPFCMRVSRLFHRLAQPFLDSEYKLTLYPPSRPPPIKTHIRTINVMPSFGMHQVCQFILGVEAPPLSARNPDLQSFCPRLRTLSVQIHAAITPEIYDLLSYLPRLTRLELESQSIEIDVPLLLILLPNLLHLALYHCHYLGWTGLSTDQTQRPCLNGLTHLAARSFPLRSLAHGFQLFETVDPILMLSMLPQLQELDVTSRHFFRSVYETHFYNPVEYARALHHFCPLIERYSVIDWLPLCLFLPRSVASAPIALSLAPTPRREIASPVFHPGLISSLSPSEMVPILPNLKNLRCSATLGDVRTEFYEPSSITLLASQDVLRLDRLAHLVRLDISLRTRPYTPDHKKDTPPEMARLGQTPIKGRDILRVLETCPSLKVLLARGRVVRFEEMLERAGLCREDTQQDDLPDKIMRWACRDHLETLSIGIVVSTSSVRCHRFVWSHLAQLARMKHLMLTWTSLFVTLTYGVDLTGHWAQLETFGVEMSPWPLANDETAFWMGQHWLKMKVYYVEMVNFVTLASHMGDCLQAGSKTHLPESEYVNITVKPARIFIPPW